ncbi:Major facilitator superfamily domain general substrate transporter [Penicillium odoratum]|uniref:Major facilitator superfamily domain general substrate transporter n=1 Tax=Penicillium odoratum TaxID=1167516 RepID=UPI002548EDF6|nr:Major facilitator superfamily domain general substrate transporter [Penicillium odoratum]KAJ5772274.1 Major facilitator superfamily domain general substrate transporter [Penicillium odoratum]
MTPETTNPKAPPRGSYMENSDLHDQTQRLSFPRLIAAYLCLCACYFISYLDMNSTTTALPTISAALSAGTTITWAGTAFLLGQTIFQPLYGRISDIAGRKPVLLASVGCIFVGDLLSGWARSALWLYITRALSGIGAGGISSLVAIIVSDLVSLKERGKYQGMRDEDGWRWVFWVPSILALVCAVVLVFVLPLKPVVGSWREKVKKIDWFGVCASVTGIVLLLIPINSGGSIWSWHSALIIALLTLGGVFLVLFVFNEGLVAKIPLMPLRLFQKRSLTIMLVSGALHDYAWQATQYFMPLYFQKIRGYSPLESATLTLPYVLAQSLAGAASGPLMSRSARYAPVLRAGFLLWTLGAGLNLLFTRHTHVAIYVVVLAIEGAGVGFVHQPGLVAVQALSRPEDRAVATSTRNLLRSLGSVFGVAISTVVQNTVIQWGLRDAVPSDLLSEVLDGNWTISDASTEEYRSQILDAKMKGFRVVFIILIPLMCLCFIGNFFVADTVLKGDVKEKDQEKRTTLGGRILENPSTNGNPEKHTEV